MKARKAEVATALKADLAAGGYPPNANPGAIDWVTLYGWMLVFVIAACALYGPQAAALVEMFPTDPLHGDEPALSYRHRLGRRLPAVTSFALVAITGDIYAGLWYRSSSRRSAWSAR